MSQLKLSLDLSSLPFSLEKGLQTAAALGLDAVEIDARGQFSPGELSQTALRQVRKLLEDSRLRVASVRFRTRRPYHVLEDLDARIEATRRAMRFAYSLGAGVVVNHVGRVPPGDDAPEWKLLVDVLRDLGDYGQRSGALLAAETGSESGADLARLIAALPHGALGVDFNPGNLMLGGFDPLETIAAVGQWILNVHVSDAVGGAGYRGGHPSSLGQGSADLPAILAALEERDYRGYFCLRSLSTVNPVEELTRAVEAMRRM